ncbi:putative bifunctional diguanylate cyclase/phosphodiesterase [Crossiella cryophila]|uniref:Diguanylate cyclase (GGDEF)-like protein/PAS domain S-box-containing protein n=1 Tax=Crossiella cryophila TaxID=43355 RepID=A0A7W7CKL9_9PSEU|nr:EAL domain-containing protein [Crossiella cryophila]MBB4681526.1 diguanylate cyclase (GGDEF)-like protein/PAS domain S-box-containing protein [Crossiella cryophila]
MNRAELAERWLAEITRTVYVPMSRTEIGEFLLELVHELVEELRAPDGETSRAGEVGQALVGGQFTRAESLLCSMRVLGSGLPELDELAGRPELTQRVILALGAVSAGYAEAMRQRTFEQQEDVKQALLRAKDNAERAMRGSEARLREVFTSSVVGIAITELDGTFVNFNQALCGILGQDPADLGGRGLMDFVHPDTAGEVARAYDALFAGRQERFRVLARLHKGEEETGFAYLAVSLLRDEQGSPTSCVTMVEDVTELKMVQDRLHHQALHDRLTGLANRQFFLTRLESVLGRIEPSTGMSLYHLDIDGFGMINSGLGHEVGDQVLQLVAAKLKMVVDKEKALVARFGGDEFAILIEHTASTPDVATMAARINEELGEPVYLTERGVAVSASIGVVQQQAGRIKPVELLRSAAGTLRRVKASGRRQWGLHDPDADRRDRDWFALAATMPGAWENGELRLLYQPVRQLADDRLAGVEVLLHWVHPDRGEIGHDECVRLAEETGLTILIGQWMLRTACEQVRLWQQEFQAPVPPIGLRLGKSQAADPDLVGDVRKVLDGYGLLPDQLWLGVPAAALLAGFGEVEDNVETLAGMEIPVLLDEFCCGTDELTLLDELAVSSVRLSARLVQRLGHPCPPTLLTEAVRNLVPLVHQLEAAVLMDGITTAEHAHRCRNLGADLAQGAYFGRPGPPAEMSALLARSFS